MFFFYRWLFWKPTHTCWDSPSLSPLCTASSSSLPLKMVRSQQSVNTKQLIVRFYLPYSVFTSALSSLLRHPVLEQQTVSRGSICAVHHIWSVSVSGGAVVHTWQRNQLCGAGQRLHRSPYWSVENHQGHGCQSKSDIFFSPALPTFISMLLLYFPNNLCCCLSVAWQREQNCRDYPKIGIHR